MEKPLTLFSEIMMKDANPVGLLYNYSAAPPVRYGNCSKLVIQTAYRANKYSSNLQGDPYIEPASPEHFVRMELKKFNGVGVPDIFSEGAQRFYKRHGVRLTSEYSR